MSEIHFECPHCEKHLAIDSQAAGMSVRCPDCRGIATVPQQSPPRRAALASDEPAPPSGPAPEPGRDRLKQEVKALQTQLHLAQDHNKKLDFELGDLRTRMQELSKVHSAAVERSRDLQQALEALQSEHDERLSRQDEDRAAAAHADTATRQDLEKQLQDLQASREALQAEGDAARAENEKLVKQCEALQAAQAGGSQMLEQAAQDAAARLAAAGEEAEARQAALQTERDIARSEQEQLTQELEALRKRHHETEAQLKALQEEAIPPDEAAAAEAQREVLQAERDTARNDLAQRSQELEQLRALHQETEARLKALQEEAVTPGETAAEAEVAALQTERDAARKEAEELSRELEALRNRPSEAGASLEERPAGEGTSRLDELEKLLSMSEARCVELNAELNRHQQEAKAYQDQLKTSGDLIARLEKKGPAPGPDKPARAMSAESLASVRDKMLRKTKPGIEPETKVPEPSSSGPALRPPAKSEPAGSKPPHSVASHGSRPDPFMHIPQGNRGLKVAGIVIALLLAGYLIYDHFGPGTTREFFGAEGHLFSDISIPLSRDKMKKVSLGESVLVDGVQVDFFRVRVDRIARRSLSGSRNMSEKTYLILDFKMRNAPNNHPVYFTRLWQETDLHLASGGKIRQAFPHSKISIDEVEGNVDNTSLEPGQRIEGSLVFELPPDDAEGFTLISNPGFYRKIADRERISLDEKLGIPREPDRESGYAPISDRLFAVEFSRGDISRATVENITPGGMDSSADVTGQTAASGAPQHQ